MVARTLEIKNLCKNNKIINMDAASLFVQPPKLRQIGSAAIESIMESKSRNSSYYNGNIQQPLKTENPDLARILKALGDDYSNYRYTVYRCAIKFNRLQKKFHTSNVPYKLIHSVMERHGLFEIDVNLMVPPFQLTSLIHDIFFACDKLGHFSKSSEFNIETATSTLANFFWSLYDPLRHHSISLLEIKVTFLLLSKLQANDQLFYEFYNLLYDRKTKCVTKFSFGYLMNILAKIFTYIGEGSAYGSHNCEIILSQIFARYSNIVGLTEHQFFGLWSTTQTRFLIYANLIALIKRLEETEKLMHNNACASCGLEKIVGIRFKCSSCKTLSLCLKCFATGYSTSRHEPGHRMYEVFTEDQPTKKISHYFAKLCNFFLFSSSKDDDERKSFCNTPQQNQNNHHCRRSDTEMITIASNTQHNQYESFPNSTNTTTSTTTGTVINSNSKGITTKAIDHHNSLDKKTYNISAEERNELLGPSLANLSNTASNACMVSERLQSIIDRLVLQNVKLEKQLKCVKTSTPEQIFVFLCAHKQFLNEIISEMREFSLSQTSKSSYPSSSTPNNSVLLHKSVVATTTIPNSNNNLTHSINAAAINRSYLDANKSDYSINDISVWFNNKSPSNQKRLSEVSSKMPNEQSYLSKDSIAMSKQNLLKNAICNDITSSTFLKARRNSVPLSKSTVSLLESMDTRETNIANFRLLVNKLRKMMEESYGDNHELAAATDNFENVLDSIMKDEEDSRRRST